jgi:sulfate transport system ATP-binding protein
LHDELHITSIFVTHDQEEALEVADRVVLMNKGHVEQIGTPDQVYDNPATPFVYGFLGSVNLFHGRVDGEHVNLAGHAHRYDEVLSNGADVIAFARPHELDIVLDTPGAAGIAAKVTRILNFGATSRIELEGEPDSGVPAHVEVEVSRVRVRELALAEGARVRLVPSQLKVFEQAAVATAGGTANQGIAQGVTP